MTARAKRVPVRYLALLCEALAAQGVDTAPLLRAAGLEAARLDERDASLQLANVNDFIAAAPRVTGRSDLGFELGRCIRMTSHGLLGYGMLCCRNVDEVLRLAERHYHLMNELFVMRYHRDAAHGELMFTPATHMPLATLRFYYEVLALSHQNQVHTILGAHTPPYDIHLSMPEPPHLGRYQAMAPVRFHFEEGALPGVRVRMSAHMLDMPMPLADPQVARDVDARCSLLGPQPPTEDASWGDYVTMLLRQTEGERLTLDDLARRIKVSARTIDRHLKKENLQFRDMALRVRFERACELLAAPGATVVQVALALGFSDAANFSRAFRRVFGTSPTEYQQRLACLPVHVPEASHG